MTTLDELIEAEGYRPIDLYGRTTMSDLHDFLGKIEWEGGVDEALNYGLTTDGYTLPDDVRQAWDALVKLHGEYEEKRKEHLGTIEGFIESGEG